MNNFELVVERLCCELSILPTGRNLIYKAARDSPVRDVQSHAGNVVIRFQSRKMQRAFMLESRTGEAPRAILIEKDKEALFYFTQPFTVDLTLFNEEGIACGRTQYTPDFLVIRRDSIQVVEARDEARLIKDSLKSDQFYKDSDGTWHWRPAEKYFQSLGFEYVLLSNAAIPGILVTNIRFLEDYCRPDCPPLAEDICNSLISQLRQHRFLPLHKLLDTFNFTADSIFQAVLAGDVYVDLVRQRLDIGEELMIFSDQPTADAYRLAENANREPPLPLPGNLHIQAGSKITFDGKPYQVVLCGETQASLCDEDGLLKVIPIAAIRDLHQLAAVSSNTAESAAAPRQTLADVSPEELDRALVRLQSLESWDTQTTYSSRSLRRFAEATQHAQTRIDKLLALVDENRNRGGHVSNIPDIVEELAQQAIVERFNQPEACSMRAAFGFYVELCHQRALQEGISIEPMSYVTFTLRCHDKKNIKKRHGRRVDYQEAPIPLFLDYDQPIHGVRPHEVCYIDHTTATIATKSPKGVDLGKPTLSAAIDGNTLQTRAFITTYHAPSVAVVFILLRDYVRRHGRLPRILVTDNGPEFWARSLQKFCDIYHIDLRWRKKSEPRGGSLIERLLGGTEEEVISNMRGNTRQMRDARLVTPEVDPFKRATWTLPAFWGSLNEFFTETKHQRIHPTFGMTPNEFEQKRLKETGERAHTFVRFDENLLLLTSPHPPRPYHVVDPQRGIWVDNAYHWHPAFSKVKPKTKVEVRIEPWNPDVVYAQIDGGWKLAIIRNSRPLSGLTRRTATAAIREHRRLAKVNANKDTISPENLRKKERLWVAENFDPRLKAQDDESLYLFNALGISYAMDGAKPATESVDRFTASISEPEEIDCPAHDNAAPPSQEDAVPPKPRDNSASATKSLNPFLENIDGLY